MTSPMDTHEGLNRWYLGSMNDGLFIINRPSRPSNDDQWHDRPDGPTLVLNVTNLPRTKAEAIVEAHNAALGVAQAVRNGEAVIDALVAAREWIIYKAPDADLMNQINAAIGLREPSHDPQGVISDGSKEPDTEMLGRQPRDASSLPSTDRGDGYYGCSMPPGACHCPQADRHKCHSAHWVSALPRPHHSTTEIKG